MGKWRKPAKNTVIEPQWRGIFATCNRGREAQCAKEVREWFEAVAEEMYPPSAAESGPGEAAALENSSSEKRDPSAGLEDSLSNELEGLRQSKRKLVVVHAKLGVDCVVFVQTRHPVDPVKLCLEVCSEVASGRRSARHIQKLSPVQKFIKCEEGLDGVDALKATIDEHLRPETSFAIRPTLRLSPVTRDKVIPAVARLVGPNHKVDLQNYEQLILVEGLRGVLGLSVLDTNAERAQQLCKFNLVQLTAARAQQELDLETA